MCSVIQPRFIESTLFKGQCPAAKEADKSLSTQNLESDGPHGRNTGQLAAKDNLPKEAFSVSAEFYQK